MPIAAIPLAIAGVAGAAISSHGASSAANAQAAAADQAAQLQHQDAQAALDFQRQQYATSLGLMRPYYNTGTSALGNLSYLMGLSGSRPQLLTGGYNAPSATGTAGATDPFSAAVNPTNPALTAQGVGDSSVQALIMRNPTVAAKFGIDTGQFMIPNAPAANAMQRPQTGTDIAPTAAGGFPQFGTNSMGSDNQMAGLEDPGQFGAPGSLLSGGQGATNALTPMNGQPGQLTVPADGTTGGADLGSFGSLMQPFSEKFTAPTDITEQNDPGFQARLKLGQQAIENSAAARGSVLGGNTLTDLSKFGQDYASNEYNNVYNRQMGEYLNRYNMFNQNQSNQYNRLASLAGLGQTSTNQLVNAGQGFANNASNILLTSGQQQANQLNNAAAARASGYASQGNIWGNTISNLGSLALLMGRGNSGTPNYPTPDYGAIGF